MVTKLLALIVAIPSAYAGYDAFKEPSQAPSDYVTKEKCSSLQAKYSSRYSPAVLNSIFSVQKNALPSIEEIFRRIGDVEKKEPLPYLKADVLGLARCGRNIDDVIYSLINRTIVYEQAQQRDNGSQNLSYPEYPMSLETYLDKKLRIQYLNLVDQSKIKTQAFPVKKFPATIGSNKVSVKERLYTLYNEKQMERMAKVMSFVIDAMNADRVFTTIEFNKGSKRDNLVIDHNAGDIYRLALKLFKQKQAELRNESFFEGKPVSNIDILAAAYEWGVLADKEISILTNDESFYTKEVSFLKKLGKYFAGLGLSAAQINPVTAPYALVGVILYNTYQEMNKGDDRVELENLLF